VEVAIRNGGLVMLVPNGALFDEVRVQIEGEHLFWIETGPLRGERLRFVLDGAGQVTGAWVGPHPFERI
jgi:hypothetical protein